MMSRSELFSHIQLKQLPYLFKTFLLIGSTSFGGYTSLIAMMRNRMVVRDKSIDDQLITEGISLASMLPGPVAVNVVAYTGFHLAGVSGAIISTLAVLLPSFLLVLILTWTYSHLETGTLITSVLMGIFPVVAGVILATGLSMGKKICTKLPTIAIAVFAFLMLLFFQSYAIIILVLFLSASAGILFLKEDIKTIPVVERRNWKPILVTIVIYVVILISIIAVSSGTVLGELFKQFTYVSLTLFGGGYVMVPVLKNLLVEQLAWFNSQEFIYGISIGQVTPGPILISSVFFGYKMAGLLGAVIATIAIFFPSALLMIILSNVFNSVKNNLVIQSALQGLKPAIVGMIVFSALSIFREYTNTSNMVLSLILTGVSFWLVFRYNIANAILIISGGLLGFFIY